MIDPQKSSSQNKCSICDTHLKGPFCHQCGQKYTGSKISFLDLIHAFLSGLLSVERGIAGNFKNLLLKPRFVVENYAYGYRKQLYSPGQMLLYALLVVGLHVSLVDSYILGVDIELDINESWWKIFVSPQLLLILFILPFYSLTTFMVFFKEKKSFLEHFIAATYSLSFSAIISTILGDILYYLYLVELSFSSLLFLVSLFLWSTRIFAPRKRWYVQVGLFFLQFLIFLAAIAAMLLVLAGTENFQLD